MLNLHYYEHLQTFTVDLLDTQSYHFINGTWIKNDSSKHRDNVTHYP